jgi:penicillin amidase
VPASSRFWPTHPIRFAVRLLVFAIVIAILTAFVIVAAVTARGFPQLSGTIHIPGLHAQVTVQRDDNGIAQITADDPHDLFLAQGYVHAQERMWQMEISRRIGAGRLSELFGPSQVDTDSYIRTLGWRQAAQRDLDAMPDDVKADLQAYSDGVNAWIHEHDGRLPLAFVVAGLKSGSGGVGGLHLEDWTPLDSATWQKVQAWSLGNNVDQEIFRLLSDRKTGDQTMTDVLFQGYPSTAAVITPSGLPGSGGAAAVAPTSAAVAAASPAYAALTRMPDTAAAGLGHLAVLATAIGNLAGLDSSAGGIGNHGVGSNDWVVSGAHTASGKPILANDPHLGYGLPSVWYMNGLHCRTVSLACPYDVVGVSFPGAPAVILGHNARIAWGATNVGPDTEDLFVETIDPKDPTHYLYKGQSLPFDTRTETINVAGGDPVTITIRSTVHGPILSDVDKRLANTNPLALEWTTTKEVDGALATFFRIDAAASFDQFKAAFDTYGSPSQNFVFADVDGHIGYVLPGLIPIRAGGCPQSNCAYSDNAPYIGDRIRNGTSGDADWTGYIPRQDLPWQLDPPSGMIVSANNAAVDAKYPYWMGDDWDPGYRAARITQLLQQKPTGLTAADIATIQMDTHVLRADQIIPALQALGVTPATADGKLLLDRIGSWDRTCTTDSLGCAAYMTAELEIERAFLDPHLGDLARDYVGTPYAWQALEFLLAHPKDHWWNDPATAGPDEEAPAQIAKALDKAGAELRAAFGDPAGWTWGRMHTVTFREGTLGSSGISVLEAYFDAATIPVNGASGAVDNTYYQERNVYPDPTDPTFVPVGIDHAFDVTNGPSYRLAVDIADLDGARIVITTGQSGNPLDRHYADLIPKWASGATLPLPFSRSAIDGSTVATLTLSP